MKTTRKIITALFVLLICGPGFGQSAGPAQSICQGDILTTAAIGTGTWEASVNNPSPTTIALATSPSTTISGFTVPGMYVFAWIPGDSLHVYVQNVLTPPTLTGGSHCVGSDSLLLSGTYGLDQIKWYFNGSLVHTTDLPFSIIAKNGPGGASMGRPTDMAFDGAGNLYVMDYSYSRVLKYPAGTTAGTNGTVVAGGNGQGSATNQFNGAFSIFVDSIGYLYVSDGGNNRILKFPPGSTSATNGTIVAGGNGGGSAANQLAYPRVLFVDRLGTLYVSDPNNQRVQKFPPGSTSATNGVTVAGGNGQGTAANQFQFPVSVSVDANDNLYVLDQGNYRVLKFPSGSTSATAGVTIAGGNGVGHALNQIPAGLSMFLDRSDNLYVGDMGNGVMKFPAGSTAGTYATVVAGSNGYISTPSAVYVDDSGYVYIAENFADQIYKWSRARIDSVYRPVTSGSYYATYTSTQSGCLRTVSDTILFTSCLLDSVWPGDANRNGIADNNDLLPIGIGYGLNGFTRPDQSIVWSAHYAQDWGLQFTSGINAKHADCDGSGVIDANDTTAILANFGFTHAKTNGYGVPWRSGIPGISLRFSRDTLIDGDTLITSLILGDSVNAVSNLYGLAFTFHYDPLVSDSTRSSFGFINSFIGNNTNRISIHKDFRTAGEIKAALTGINHLNRSGYGEIARFSTIITTENLNGKDLRYYSNINFISDITAIDKDENVITLNAGTDSNSVAYEPTGIRDLSGSAHILLSPNPAATQVRVSADAIITDIRITDIVGAEVYSRTVISGRSDMIDISGFSAGIYTVHIVTASGTGTARLAVSR